MNPETAAFIQAASVAAWWTTLIAAIWITVAWLVWRFVTRTKPAWLMKLWGFELTWPDVQKTMFYALAIMKMILFILVLAAIWLSLWA